MMLFFQNIQNYLCYQLVQLPKYTQRYFAIAGLVLSCIFAVLLFFVVKDIVTPALKYQLTTQSQFLHALLVLSLTLIAHLSLNAYLLVIDNAITHSPYKPQHKNSWSLVNITILIFMATGMIFFLGTLVFFISSFFLDAFMLSPGTLEISTYSYLVCFFALYIGVVANYARSCELLFYYHRILGLNASYELSIKT